MFCHDCGGLCFDCESKVCVSSPSKRQAYFATVRELSDVKRRFLAPITTTTTAAGRGNHRDCSWRLWTAHLICGICLECCNERDERDRQIDAGAIAYVPPDQRPGHRFYKGPSGKRQMTEARKQSLAQARAAKSLKQIAGDEHNNASEAVKPRLSLNVTHAAQ